MFLVPRCSQERKEDGVSNCRTQHLVEAQRPRGAMVGSCYQVPVNRYDLPKSRVRELKGISQAHTACKS